MTLRINFEFCKIIINRVFIYSYYVKLCMMYTYIQYTHIHGIYFFYMIEGLSSDIEFKKKNGFFPLEILTFWVN